MYLFQFSTCFEQPRAHHQEKQVYQYNIWYMSLCSGDRFVCRSERNFPTCTRNGHRLSDIYQMFYWYNWFSWWWARGCSKHVENWNKYIEENCASSWSFTKNLDGCPPLGILLDQFLSKCRPRNAAGPRISYAWPYKTTNVMHWILFIRQILLLSSTCFEYQVLIFRRTQLYISSIWYRHSL